MEKDEIYYLVAKGGYVGEKPIVKRITVTPEEVESLMEDDDDLEEGDAINEILSDIAAGYEQGFARTMIFTEKEFKKLFKPDVKVQDLF